VGGDAVTLANMTPAEVTAFLNGALFSAQMVRSWLVEANMARLERMMERRPYLFAPDARNVIGRLSFMLDSGQWSERDLRLVKRDIESEITGIVMVYAMKFGAWPND
jgi:hypothetical protein